MDERCGMIQVHTQGILTMDERCGMIQVHTQNNNYTCWNKYFISHRKNTCLLNKYLDLTNISMEHWTEYTING